MTQPRTFTPRPYQKLIMDHQLDTARCGIWAGMGMGKTSSTLTMINDLQLLEGNPVLFAHPASAGHGLNLQDGGNILAFFGMDWNLENRLQIIERIGPTRQLQAGHNRPVFIYNILARDTVDEMVLQRVETKRAVQDLLLDAMKTRGFK